MHRLQPLCGHLFCFPQKPQPKAYFDPPGGRWSAAIWARLAWRNPAGRMAWAGLWRGWRGRFAGVWRGARNSATLADRRGSGRRMLWSGQWENGTDPPASAGIADLVAPAGVCGRWGCLYLAARTVARLPRRDLLHPRMRRWASRMRCGSSERSPSRTSRIISFRRVR